MRLIYHQITGVQIFLEEDLHFFVFIVVDLARVDFDFLILIFFKLVALDWTQVMGSWSQTF